MLPRVAAEAAARAQELVACYFLLNVAWSPGGWENVVLPNS